MWKGGNQERVEEAKGWKVAMGIDEVPNEM